MSIIIPEKNLPTMAIVGRTNVGKSTLFNRLMEENKALVSPVAGTTRTSNVGIFNWRGLPYRLIDTGGVDFTKGDLLEKEIKKQVTKAFTEASVIIFVVDLKQNLLPQEKEWAKALRALKKPIVLIGNKADNAKFRENAHNPEWLSLGLGEPLAISSVNGSGIGDMLDILIKKVKPAKESKNKIPEKKALKIALIGRPNVGKSTLFNSLIGEERVITSPVAHTTRESHDTLIIKDDEPYIFVDTAGIRRQNKVQRGLEFGGVEQAVESIEKSDIVLLVLDASEPFTTQDKHLIQIISEHRRGLIIIINKWDLIPDKQSDTQDVITKQLFNLFPPLSFAPVFFTSALTHRNIQNLFPLLNQVATNLNKQIEEKDLRHFMERLVRFKLPTRGKGVRHPKIFALRQMGINPPTFEVTIKQKTSLHESYLKFIQNNLRQIFDFTGVPVVVYVRKVRV